MNSNDIFKKRYDVFIDLMDDRIKFSRERIEMEERFLDPHKEALSHWKNINACEWKKLLAAELLKWRESRENLPLKENERDFAENLSRYIDIKQKALADSTNCYNEYELLGMIEAFIYETRDHWPIGDAD